MPEPLIKDTSLPNGETPEAAKTVTRPTEEATTAAAAEATADIKKIEEAKRLEIAKTQIEIFLKNWQLHNIVRLNWNNVEGNKLQTVAKIVIDFYSSIKDIAPFIRNFGLTSKIRPSGTPEGIWKTFFDVMNPRGELGDLLLRILQDLQAKAATDQKAKAAYEALTAELGVRL